MNQSGGPGFVGFCAWKSLMSLSQPLTSSQLCQVGLLFAHWILYWSPLVLRFILESNILSNRHSLCSSPVSASNTTTPSSLFGVSLSLTSSWPGYGSPRLSRIREVWKVFEIFHVLGRSNVTVCVPTPVTLKGPLNLSSSFLVGLSVLTFLVSNQTLSPTSYLGAADRDWFA